MPYLWALGIVAAAVALRSALSPVLGAALPFITLFPAMFVVAYLGGLGPTLLATVLAILASVFLFFEPLDPWSSGDPVALLGIALFAASGILSGWLGESRFRALERAEVAARAAADEAARAEEETIRAEEEAARAEEEAAGAEEERRRAAREAERVDRILGSITDAFLVLDHDWRISYMNDRAAALYGRPHMDYRGRNHWEVFPETAGGIFEQAYREAAATRQVVRVEGYHPSDRWLQVTIYPSSDGLTVVAHDVTDRVRAQRTEARLAAIVASSEDAIIGKQLDGTVTSWNAAAERIFGYTAEEMVGRPIYTLIPPELHETEHEVLRRVARGEPVEFSQAERIRKDGGRIFIALSVSPIQDPTGKVVGVSSIKRDITSQRNIQQALTAESARSRDLAEALDATQALLRDLDGRITYWSAGSARLYGWSASEAAGRHVDELLRTECPVALDEIQAMLLARGHWEGDVVRVAKDGRRIHVATQWILRRGETGEPAAVIEVNTDVSARREAEERLRQSERMEVVGQLAGGVAHEANNQMTVVLGAADFLLHRQDLSEVARKDIEQIRGAAERTATITAQLLAFSRRQVLQPQLLELDEVLLGLESVLRRTLGERSTLLLRPGAKSARVRADPGQLSQVLLNLVLNSRDAMPVGGRVTIGTEVTELTERYAEEHQGVMIQPGDYAVLSVSDTGHGMSPETMRHIFEPFFTTKPVGKGTGLGLATVYGIIKQSGGYIWAYTEPGQGTTFRIYLPLVGAGLPQAAAPRAEIRGKGELVLLVEDEGAVRRTIARALQEHGYAVVEAADGAEAMRVVEQRDGRIDLIVTDVVMPAMDGPELARRVSRILPHLPVLFMSGYTDDDVIRRGLLDADQPFLQKPFTPEGLVSRVAELLRSAPRQEMLRE